MENLELRSRDGMCTPIDMSAGLSYDEKRFLTGYMSVDPNSVYDCTTCNNCGSGNCSSCCSSPDD